MRLSTHPFRLRGFAAWLPALALSAVGCSSSAPSAQEAQGRGSSGARSPALVEADKLPEVARDPREPMLAELAAVLLTEKHLLQRPMDDKLSKAAFPKYVEQLDGAKQLLLQSNVTTLSAYADRMDDQLRARDLVLARKGAAMAASRRKVVSKMVAEILAQPLDFTQRQEFEMDPEKRAFCRTEAELRERWVGSVKLQVLERVQHMESLLEAGSKQKGDKKDKKKDKPKSGAGPHGSGPVPESPTEEAEDDRAAAIALADIPGTPEEREAKARDDVAKAYQSSFARLEKMEPLEPAQMFLNAITAAYDPHTQYLAPAAKENFDIAITGSLEGIGALLGEQEHYVSVQEIVPGGAAWQEGTLEAGDLIIAVAQDGKEAVDTTDMPLDRVVGMIRGPKGTVVTLTVKKPEGGIESVSIRRDVIKIEEGYARGAVLDVDGPPHPVGYIYLPSFYGNPGVAGERNSTNDVRALLAQFEKRKLGGVIIDLRGNGGGLLNHARDISGLFVDRGPIVQARDPDGKVEVLADGDPSIAFTGNVVVMVDRFSASASEIVAGALQDYERAVVVGTGPTHGKGTVQGLIELDRVVPTPGKDSLGSFKLTVQQYFRVNGASTQWKGVVPDVLLPDPSPYVESGERALPHSIPWTSIPAVDHARQQHTWKVPALNESSGKRVKAHPTFARVETFGKLVKERRADTSVSLDKETWLAERKKDKDALEGADPKLKDLKPQFVVSLLADPPAPAPATNGKKLRSRIDQWRSDLSRDIWVGEAVNVLGDMSAAR